MKIDGPHLMAFAGGVFVIAVGAVDSMGFHSSLGADRDWLLIMGGIGLIGGGASYLAGLRTPTP